MQQTKQWWKEAIVYQIYPRSFKDSNGDGIGDLAGIIQKLDYLKNLGIDVLWLCPVYKSPNDDNGYDISDYYDIMEEFGTMADFDKLLAEAHRHGLKIIMDLVVNHSSDETEWFQQSRQSKDNPYRDYYIWQPPVNGGPPNNWKSFFGGSAWEFDPTTEEYYLHLFTKKQPDLNWENQTLREEIYKMMRFWLDKGVDGFRMDVIPLLSKSKGFADTPYKAFNEVIAKTYANGPRIHEFIQEMHQNVMAHYDVMTVGEAVGVDKEQAKLYVGQGRQELNMIFQFDHLFIDHGPGGKFDIVPFTVNDVKNIFTAWDKAMDGVGWNSIFLDNHDFPRMVSRFGNDTKYRREASKLLFTLLLTLRGTPYIYQGDEIGMTNVAFKSIDDYRDIETLNFYKETQEAGGDMAEFLKKVHIQGRDNVRTPMHWDDSPNAGFTTGTPWIKLNPNYEHINVRAEKEARNSILSFVKDFIQFRKANELFVYGSFRQNDNGHEHIFSYLRELNGQMALVMLNFSNEQNAIVMDDLLPPMKVVKSNYPDTIGQDFVSHIELQPWQAVVFLNK